MWIYDLFMFFMYDIVSVSVLEPLIVSLCIYALSTCNVWCLLNPNIPFSFWAYILFVLLSLGSLASHSWLLLINGGFSVG